MTDSLLDIVRIRSDLGWSQKRMAEYFGCNQATICRREETGRISKLVENEYRRLKAVAAPGKSSKKNEVTP